MMETDSTNIPGADGFAEDELFPQGPGTFAGHTYIEEDWDAFDQEWCQFTADFEIDTQQSSVGTVPTDTLIINQQVDEPLLSWHWDMFPPLGEPDSINYPEYSISLQSSTATPEMRQLFPPLPSDSTSFPYPWSSISSSSPNTMASTSSNTISEHQFQPPSLSNNPHLISSSPSVSASSSRAVSRGVPKQISSPQTAPHSCNSCSKTFSKRHDLNRHTKNHTKPIRCPVQACRHRTAKNKDMNRHLVAKHPQHDAARVMLAAPRISCMVQGCEFVQKGGRRMDNLKRHMRNKHAREVL